MLKNSGIILLMILIIIFLNGVVSAQNQDLYFRNQTEPLDFVGDYNFLLMGELNKQDQKNIVDYNFNYNYFNYKKGVEKMKWLIVYDSLKGRKCIEIYKEDSVNDIMKRNHLIKNIDIEHINKKPNKIKADLKELVGHTPFEVLAGAGLGIIIALTYYYL